MQTHAHAREIVAGGITREERQRGMGEGGKKYIKKKNLKKNFKEELRTFSRLLELKRGCKAAVEGENRKREVVSNPTTGD